MARLVVFFLVHPGGRFHVRELMRQTRLPSASLQTELRRLTVLGTLRRDDEGGRAFYSADREHAAWRAWILLLRACARPADVLREALVDASGIEGAFVFGSVARNDAGPESDLDVLLVGDEAARQQAGRVLSDASVLIDRDLDVVGYAQDELRARLRSGNAFIQRVLEGPKEWLRGHDGILNEGAATA
jgi:predicted nucleotidyltransferase